MRLPKRSASVMSRRCIVAAGSVPAPAGVTGCATASAAKKMPQPKAAACRAFLMRPLRAGGLLACADAAQVRRRVIAGGALDGLVDELLLVAQPHRDVAARLQVIVDFDRAVPHRNVVPDLTVGLREAPQLAAAIVLVGGEDGPAVLVDVERAAR